jgi:O-antigen ligase
VSRAVSTTPATRALRASPIVALAGAVALGFVLAELLASRPPAATTIAGAVGVIAVVALASARYELTVALGFLLLGVVRVEPAPTDALLAAAIAVALATGRFDLRRAPGAMVTLVVGLLVLNLLSMTVAADLGVALRFFAITLYLATLAVWLTTYLQGPDRMRRVVGAYVAGAAAFAAITTIDVLLAGEGATRAQGLFKDPNVFAPFLIPAALIMLEESVRPRLFGLRRAASVAVLAALVLGIVFAYSRAAWLNLAVAVVVMLVAMVLRADAGRAAGGALALIAVVAALGGVAVVATGSTGFLEERAQLQSYDTERFSAQRTGVRLAEQHILGVGPGQFEQTQPVSAHSLYVRVLAEQGILGLTLLAGLLAGTLALAVANVAAGRDAHGVGSAVLLAAWCGLLANSAFVDTLHWRHLWLVAALIWVAAMRARR